MRHRIGVPELPGRPVVVTGLPRSGTSWVGKMLEASGELVYINEPLNPQHPPGLSPGVLNAVVTNRFQYICADNQERWAHAFTDTLALRYRPGAELQRNRSLYDLGRLVKYGTAFTVGRFRGRRALLDDPFALFAVPWLVEHMQCDAVVLVRSPESFVGSWRRLAWRIRFHELLEQPLLLRDYMGPYADDMRRLLGTDDWLGQVCLLWKASYAAVAAFEERNARIRVCRYEDIAADPVPQFTGLYDFLGLPWTAQAQTRIRRSTSAHDSSKGAHQWSLRGGLSRTAFRPMDSRKAVTANRELLSPAEADRVRELTGHVATRYYGAASPNEVVT